MRRVRGWFSGAFMWMVLIAVISAVAVSASETQVTLKVATHINDPELVDAQKSLMQKFEEQHPNVKVEIWAVPWGEYHDQLLNQYLGGIGPDVASIGRFQFASFIEAGLVQPLDRFIQNDPQFNLERDTVPGVMSSGYHQGQVYGFPIYNGPAQLFYNPLLFDEAGLASPVQLIEEERWDWNSLANAAKKLTHDSDGDGNPEIFGYSGFSTWDPTWVPYVRGAGGDVVGPDGRSALNTPAVKEALNWLVDLQLHSGVVGGNWREGTQAMAIRWMSTGLIESNLIESFNLQPALIPAGPAGYAHVAGGVPVAVSAHTEHPELAYEFAKWFAMESGIWHMRGGPPLGWDAIRSPEYRETLEVFEHPEMFERALSWGDVRPEPQFGVSEYVKMNSILHESLIIPITEGRASVESAVEEAHRLLDNLLSQ